VSALAGDRALLLPVDGTSVRSAELPGGTMRAGAGDGAVAVRLRGLEKRYGDRPVLRRLGLDIARGSFVAIVGRSGCGKSTLLRIVAGLEAPDAGEVRVGAAPATDARTGGGQPGVRLMFQDPRLLPWKRVVDNVALGLASDSRARALAALHDVGLADRAHDWPARLSGGQRQRVALARALVHRPQLLLLDEPLGALDALTRIEMHGLIERLWSEHGFTALLVTHDVQEAVALADRVLVIDEGVVDLDREVALPRPRGRGTAPFATLENEVLARVLARTR
jgi:sulfonate transport system ATP-binding protein